MSKRKTYHFIFIKWSVLILLGFYIFYTLQSHNLENNSPLHFLNTLLFQKPIGFIILIFLSICNWFLEIAKWKTILQTTYKISLKLATIQTLTAHAVAMLTPFKTGDYVTKTLFFDKKDRKNILLFNALINFSQLSFTLIFGVIGIIVLQAQWEILPFKNNLFLYLLVLIAVFGWIFLIFQKQKTLHKYGFSFKRFRLELFWKIWGLSLVKYLVFSHQFYYLLVIFKIDLPYYTSILLVFSTYFISSLLPFFQLFDFVLKGSIAVFLFSRFGISAPSILSITTILWVLNFIVPAIIGGFYILKLKKINLFEMRKKWQLN